MENIDEVGKTENLELVSIIVPVYKVERYLGRCISSLIEQTYEKIELILVNDGSPDNCGKMCDEWANRDERIRVIHKSNGGLSDARNAGITAARGAYITFVDSDDWVSQNFIERMLYALQQNNCDIVECAMIRTAEQYVDFQTNDGVSTVYLAEAAMKELILDRDFHQYVWNKMYRRCLIEGILFEKGKTNEDEFWTYQIFGRASKIVKLDDVLYAYFQRSDSIMGENYSIRRLDALEAKRIRQDYIDEYFPNLSASSGVNLYCSCIYSGQMTLKYLDGDERKKAKEIIGRIQRENRMKLPWFREISGSQFLWVILASLNFWFTCRLKNLLGKGL